MKYPNWDQILSEAENLKKVLGYITGTGMDKIKNIETYLDDIYKIVLRVKTYVDVNEIEPNTNIFKKYEFDSMDIIKLIVDIEESFKIKIQPSLVKEENFCSLNNILLTLLENGE